MNTWDSQPWPGLFAVAFVSLRILFKDQRFSIPKFSIAFLLMPFVLLATPRFSLDFLALRAAYNYLSLPLIYLAFQFYITDFGFPGKLMFSVSIFWVGAGTLQLFFPNLLDEILNQRTTIGRGVTSFAPEPTYFAIFMFFMAWIWLIHYNYELNGRGRILLLLNLISLLFLSKSSMVFFYLLIVGCVYVIYMLIKAGFLGLFRSTVISLAALLMFYSIAAFFGGDSRLHYFLQVLINAENFGLGFFLNDRSAYERLVHIVLPIIGSLDASFLPKGTHSFQSFLNNAEFLFLGSIDIPDNREKIMSWYGSLIFEMGFLGLLGVFFIYTSLLKNSLRRLAELLVLSAVLLSAVPLAFPLVPFLLYVLNSKEPRLLAKAPRYFTRTTREQEIRL